MIILNKSKNPIILRHDGVAVKLAAGGFAVVEGNAEKAMLEGQKQNKVFRALSDKGLVVFGSKTKDPGTLKDVTNPAVPEKLKSDAEKNGKQAKVEKFEEAGTMAV